MKIKRNWRRKRKGDGKKEEMKKKIVIIIINNVIVWNVFARNISNAFTHAAVHICHSLFVQATGASSRSYPGKASTLLMSKTHQ